MEKLEIDLELRLRGTGGGYVVEDALVRSANVSDAELEACLVREYRGLRFDAEGAAAGEARRVDWPILVHLRR
jgi:hypothetical protein